MAEGAQVATEKDTVIEVASPLHAEEGNSGVDKGGEGHHTHLSWAMTLVGNKGDTSEGKDVNGNL